jgi:hypothetical protein
LPELDDDPDEEKTNSEAEPPKILAKKSVPRRESITQRMMEVRFAT